MELNVTSGPPGNNIEGNVCKEHSHTFIILFIIFIITTFIELFVLIVTCVNYRKRITGPLKETKPFELSFRKGSLEMRRKSINSRKSKALSAALRYVEDPTSLEQANKIIYDSLLQKNWIFHNSDDTLTCAKDTPEETEMKESPICESSAKIQNVAEPEGTNSKITHTNTESRSSPTSSKGTIGQKSRTPRQSLDEKDTENNIQGTTYENYRDYSIIQYGSRTEVQDQPLYMNFRSEEEPTNETTVKRKIDVPNDNPDNSNERISEGSDRSTDDGSSIESHVSVTLTQHETNDRTSVNSSYIVLNIASCNLNVNTGSGNSKIVHN